jgi:hypothetical protein
MYKISINGYDSYFRNKRAGENKFIPMRKIPVTMRVTMKVKIMTALYNSSLVLDVGKNRIRPLSIPNWDNVVMRATSDITAVANPISEEDIVRAAIIQNKSPNTAPDAVFNINATEFRYNGSS